jgi:hypothetical protein
MMEPMHVHQAARVGCLIRAPGPGKKLPACVPACLHPLPEASFTQAAPAEQLHCSTEFSCLVAVSPPPHRLLHPAQLALQAPASPSAPAALPMPLHHAPCRQGHSQYSGSSQRHCLSLACLDSVALGTCKCCGAAQGLRELLLYNLQQQPAMKLVVGMQDGHGQCMLTHLLRLASAVSDPSADGP